MMHGQKNIKLNNTYSLWHTAGLF